MALTSQILKKH